MKPCALLLLLVLGCAHAAPVDPSGPQEASCSDAQVLGAARQAVAKINNDRTEGYQFALHRLSNAHLEQHGENAILFYLTMNVVETNCSVLNRDNTKNFCEPRPDHNTPVYGQCKAAIYISRVNRVVRLYKYQCAVRPVPAETLGRSCPDCPSLMKNADNDEVKKALTLSLEKFNQESGLSKRFALLKISRATSGYGMAMYYNTEYTIQETTCNKDKTAADDCPLMDCEFAHKGFCKGSLMYTDTGDSAVTVDCEIYEPEAAEAEKKLHLQSADTDHAHSDTHTHEHPHDHDHPQGADATHNHDHMHDHTKAHAHHDQKHAHSDDHHHTHDHGAGSPHRHAHAHSHDHGHDHDHVHTHHARAHDHSADSPNHHHAYTHADGTHTHEHDHELALDHDHKHAHLHDHEHHHHHHDHNHETTYHDHPEGVVKVLGSINEPVTMPVFDESARVAVTLIAKPDPQIPGMVEPTIGPFPRSVSSQCAAPVLVELTMVEQMFKDDSLFNGSM